MINIESRFDEIYREYYPVLLRYITARRLPNINPEDIAHEALTLLWEKRAECEFESDEQLAAWILRTGKFTAMSHLKKMKDEESLSDHENTVSDSDNIEQHLEDVKLRKYLEKIQQELSERDRLIFKMIFIERRSYSECAEELKMKEVTLRSCISRLRDRLRPYMDKLFDEEK